MSSESFSETRSQPPSPPSPASPAAPSPPPSPPSPSIPSTPKNGSSHVFTGPASSSASSQPTSAPSSHTSSAESSLFDLSVFFSLDPRPVMTRDPSSGINPPSLPSSEVDPQSIPQSMSSSQASENFTAPRGTWTVSREEYPRLTDNLQPNSQSSSEEGYIYFTGTLPLSPPIPISPCQGGFQIEPSSSETSPERSVYLTAPISPVSLPEAVHDPSQTTSISQSGSRASLSIAPTLPDSPFNSQATSPDTSNPQTRPNIHPTPILQIRTPGSWVSSRSTSPIPSPPSSISQPSAQPHTKTSSNPYPSPILQVEVTIMPGSWVSLPNSPISSLPGSPVSTNAFTLTNPADDDTHSTCTPEITITIAGLKICNPTPSNTNTSTTTDTNINTCTDPSNITSSTTNVKSSSNSSSSSIINTTEGPPNTASSLTTRSSRESSRGTCNLSAPPSPVSSTCSAEPACVQQ